MYFSSVSINSWTMLLQEKEEIGCLDARIMHCCARMYAKRKVEEWKQQNLGKQ